MPEAHIALTLLALFTLGTLLVAWTRARRGLPLVFVLHLVLIAVMLGGYDIVALTVSEYRFRADLLLAQLLLLALSVGLIAWIGHRRSDVLVEAIRIPGCWLIGAMVVFLALKMYLVAQYGLAGLAVLRDREVVGMETWEVLADTLAFYPALGAFWLATVRLGHGAGVGLTLLWTVFWIWPLVGFGEIGGARRFALSTFALLGVTLWARRRYRLSVRTVLVASAMTLAVLGVSSYFQAIRTRLDAPQMARALAAGHLADALTLYFMPPSGMVDQLTDNLAERLSPLVLLYELTGEQFRSPRVAGGRVVFGSLENVVPRFLLPSKEYVNTDEVLAAVFGFPFMDLPASLFVAGQAEVLWLAYLVVPLIIGGLLLGYGRLFRWAATHSPLLAMAMWAVLIRAAVTIEEGPDFLLADARHLLAFVGLTGAGMVLRRLRRSPGVASAPFPTPRPHTGAATSRGCL